jgi:hypothetical protein
MDTGFAFQLLTLVNDAAMHMGSRLILIPVIFLLCREIRLNIRYVPTFSTIMSFKY